MKKHCIFYCILFFLNITLGLTQFTWTQKASLPALGRRGSTGFSIGTKGYIGCGLTVSGGINDFWEWDQNNNTWTQKANFPIARWDASGFSIGTKGYFCCGISGSFYNDLWEWDQSLNSWTQKASMPVAAGSRATAVGFAIGNKGYIGTGLTSTSSYLSDLWEWDQTTNSWLQKNSFPSARAFATGFCIGNLIYVGTGAAGSNYLNDFWEWNQTTNVWTQRANIPITQRYEAIGFAIGTKGYIGTGNDGGDNNNFVEWNSSTSSWSPAINLPSNIRSDADRGTFTICDKGYFCGGWNGSTYFNDFWEFSNGTIFSIAISSSSTSICSGGNVTLTASGGASYSWSNGATSVSIIVSPTSTTSYSVTASNGSCTAVASSTVAVNSMPVITLSGNTSICSGAAATLTASGGASYSWSNGATSASIIVSPTSTSAYSVTATSAGGCTSTAFSTVNVGNFNPVNAGPNVTINLGDTATLSASGGTHYSWSNGSTNSIVSVSPAVTTVYYVTAPDTTGCSGMDSVTVFIVISENDCGNASSDLIIPNAFSPNNDGENDVLMIFYKKGIFCITEFELNIFNRWGQKVFETARATDYWNGTFNGKMLSSGVYVYYCKIKTTDGQSAVKKGNISILR